MAAKIGILGEDTAVARATLTTVYTVPADKAARIRVKFVIEGGSEGWNYAMEIGSPNAEITMLFNPGANGDCYSGIQEIGTPDPANSHQFDEGGVQQQTGNIDISSVSAGDEHIQVALPFDYFLSTGDTVKWNLNSASTNAVDHLYQVIGVEDDA